MMKTVVPILVAVAASTASAFSFDASSSSNRRSESCGLYMGGSSKFATSLVGKKEKVSTVKSLLERSEMIFSIPANSLTVLQTQKLRRALPETTVMSVVKNKLMCRALEETPAYNAALDIVKGPNMWFFIEDDIGGTVKAYQTFCKEANKMETHSILGGVMDGMAYDKQGIERIAKLPTKIQLITMIARSIKSVPTKVARVIKAPGNKLGRAIRLATMPEEKPEEETTTNNSE